MPVVGNSFQGDSSGGYAIGELLNGVLSGVTQRKKANEVRTQENAYRLAMKQELGIDTSSYTIPELQEMRKEKYKADLNPENKLITAALSESTQPAAVPEGSVMPGIQPVANSGDNLGLDKGKLLRGILSKKFGVPYEQMMTPEERQSERSTKLSEEINKKELVSASTALPKLEQALQSINQLESLYYQGATPDKNPFTARVTGPFDTIGARSGFNPKLNSYLNNRKAFAGLIAKGGFGEAGMLTNQDIDRVVSALPSSGSTAEEAKIGFDEIKTLLQSARNRFEERKQNYFSGNDNQKKVGKYTLIQ